MTPRILLVTSALLLAAGCNKAAVIPPVPDSGEPGEGACTSQANAQNCTLMDGVAVQQYLWPAGTADWYYIDATTTLPPRALLTITAGYHAPSSPVVLVANVLAPDGKTSLGSMSDPGVNGGPSVFNLVIPISQAGGYYLIIEDDLSQAQNPMGDGDSEHEYTVSYTITSDPDLSGHTFGTATPVTLTNDVGTASGVLSTPGDMDVYSLNISADPSLTRPILYFSVDAPQFELGNQTTIEFNIYDSPDGGAPVASGTTQNPTIEQISSTAILLPPTGGQYYITVQGEPSPAPGNPNFKYNLSFQLLQDLDANEPNDDPTLATPIDFTGSPTPTSTDPNSAAPPVEISKEGRIAYVPDPDWYQIKIPASGVNTRVYFSMNFNGSAANNARYPPMPTSFNHQLMVNITSPAADACENSCPGNTQAIDTYCTDAIAIVNGTAYYPCPYSIRQQDPNYQQLQNFEGVVPIAASGAETDLYVLVFVPDLGADDLAYDLNVTWEPAVTGEDQSYANSYTDAQVVSTTIQSSYSDVPSTSAIAGAMGYGNFLQSQGGNNAPNTAGLLPQAANDYDALRDSRMYEIDVNVVEYPDGGSNLRDGVIDGGFIDAGFNMDGTPNLIFVDGGPNYVSLSMELQWVIPPGGAMPNTNQQDQTQGERPYDIFIYPTFCDPNENKSCDPANGKWRVYQLGYASGSLASWEGGPPTPVYNFDQNSGTFLSLPPECLCVEPRFVHGLENTGKFYVQVTGVDRTSYADSDYQLSLALGPYPQTYTNGDGGVGPCPEVCKFCNQGGGCQQIQGLPTGPGPIP